MTPCCETALIAWKRDDVRAFDVAAGEGGAMRAVAKGLGGHFTGWLPARLALRTLMGERARFAGAADALPAAWGWAGGEQDDAGAAALYAEAEALLDTSACATGELASVLTALDRAIARLPELPARLSGPVASCTAVVIDGRRLTGAHVGIGRALRFRRTGEPESLVEEHFFHAVAHRLTDLPSPDTLPRNVMVSALGRLDPEIGIDRIACDLDDGDVVLLCANRLALDDHDLARLVHAASESATPLATLADNIARAARAKETAWPREGALVLLRVHT